MFSPVVRLGCALLLATMLAALVGCNGVQRRLTITSNPPGARVYVDGFEIGTTPVSTDYTYYGTREIRLVKDGYETQTVKQEIPAPWFQIPPFDFVTDNLMWREIRDERTVSFNMSPQVVVPTDSLLSRAEGLRQNANQQASFDQPTSIYGGPLQPGFESLPPGGVLPPGGAPPIGILPGPSGLPPFGAATQGLPQIEGPTLVPSTPIPQTLPSQGVPPRSLPGVAPQVQPELIGPPPLQGPPVSLPQTLSPGGVPPRYAE